MIMRLALGTLLCLAAASTALSPSDIPQDTPVAQLISQAQAVLAQGNAQDALVYYDLAIQKDPSNYLTVFKRGAAYLSLGKSVQATRDFDQVLALKPGFEGALLQRAKIKSRNAEWEGAKKDYSAASKAQGSAYQELIEAEGAAKLAQEADKKQDWEGCIAQANNAILVASTSLELRNLRAKCRFESGAIAGGISDLGHVLQINPGSPEPYLQTSAMTFYSLGEVAKGITSISRCLHNDPDNKACSKLRKAEKAIERTLKKFDLAFGKRQFASAVKLLVPQDDETGLLREIQDDTKTFREEGFIHAQAPDGLYSGLIEKVCEAYTEMNNAKKAAPYCEEALRYNPESLPALMSKAQRYMDVDEFDDAIRTLNTAKDLHGGTRKIEELLQKAHTLLKRSKQKDYYKVLGVTRDADDKEIKRAMRRLTKEFHPDKAKQNGLDPEQAEKKMAAINEAYEVLSDPELKARFDRGDDPNDPQQQSHPFQGSPFGQGGGGGQQFFFRQGPGGGGGGGAQFKFQGGMPFQFQGGGPGGGGGFPFGF